MGSHVSFFIKIENKFISIADYSRNSQIYKITSGCLPYGKVRALDVLDLERFIIIARENTNECREHIEEINTIIKNICDFSNNSVNEKLQAIKEYKENKQEWKDDLDEINFTINFFTFLEGMINNVTSGRDDKVIDVDNYLYAGIEVGEPVEVKE